MSDKNEHILGRDYNRQLFEKSIIPTFIIRLDNHEIIDLNDALGNLISVEKPDKYIGKTLLDIGELILSDDSEKLANSFMEHIEQAIKKGFHIFQWQLSYYDGQPWYGKIHLIKFTYNKQDFLQISIKDVTEYQRIEDEVKNANLELRASYEQLTATETELRASYEQLTAAEEELRQKYTELETLQEELKSREEKYRNMVESIDCIIFECNYKRVLTYISPVAKKVWGYEVEELLGRDYLEFIHPDDHEYLFNLFSRINESVEVTSTDYRIRTKSGEYKWLKNKTKIIWEDGRFIIARGVLFDIHEQKMNEEKISYLSFHDLLTGAYNRSYFEIELARYDKSEELLPISIIIADINGLKDINDKYGQDEGDKLLKYTAHILKEAVKPKGIVARIGGDEFAVLMANSDEKDIKRVLKKVKEFCDAIEEEEGVKLNLSMGTGTIYSLNDSIYEKLATTEVRLHNKKLLESSSTRSHLITSLNNIMSEKTYETREHCERLVSLSEKIAKKMNLKEYQIEKLRLLALMHDIGKIAVAENILSKPGTLTDDEWQEMKKHAEIGHRIASKTPELVDIAEEILYHHERWDGKGYPQGLKETEIPLESRIIAVVDAFDAMTTDRVYREAMPLKKAVEELQKNAGTQFDPEIVKIFTKDIMKPGNLTLYPFT